MSSPEYARGREVSALKFLCYASLLLLASAVCCTSLCAQQPEAAASRVVPHVVRYSGRLPADADASGTARFAIYAAATGGEPLWAEEQQVAPDASGRYTVLLGAATALPEEIFAQGDARWVGVTVSGMPESARTPLAAGAYALKAEDAQTLGGHPAADFVMAEKDGTKSAGTTPVSQINVTSGITGGGTGPTVTLGVDLNYLVGQGDSVWAQLGAANTFSKSQTINGNLTVNGSFAGSAVNGLLAEANTLYPQLASANSFHGTQTLAPVGTATATAGHDSNRLGLSASAFNKSSGAAQNVTYLLQAEPLANNTTVPGASLNFLFALGANAPAETGFAIGSNGVVTFAAAQTFPGTVTSVTAGNGIATSTSGSVVTVGVSPAFQATLPTLSGNNTFTGGETFNGNTSFAGTNTYAGQQTFNGIVYENNNTIQQATIDSTYVAYITNSGSGGALAVSGGANGVAASATNGLANSSGVYATSTGGYGVFASGGNSGIYSRAGTSSATYAANTGVHAGVIADGGTGSYAGLFATADSGTAVSGLNNSANATLISQNNGSGPAGYFINNTSGQYSVIAQNNAAGGAGYFSGASTSAPILTVQNRATTNPQNTQVAQFLGDNAGNVGCTVFGNGIFSCSNALIGYASSGTAIQGTSTTSSASGVFGGFSSRSSTYQGQYTYPAGIVADAGSSTNGGAVAINATANDTAGNFLSNSSGTTVQVQNFGSGTGLSVYVAQSGTGPVAQFGGPNNGGCFIFQDGDLVCSGNISSSQVVRGETADRNLATPGVLGSRAWIEDADTADLVDGRALVHLDAGLMAVADTGVTYQVFLTPGGDCGGLYVSHKKPDSFEVHELNGGHSSLPFDYRVLVSRRGSKSDKFEDVTAKLHRSNPGEHDVAAQADSR